MDALYNFRENAAKPPLSHVGKGERISGNIKRGCKAKGKTSIARVLADELFH